jgi:hypothetical protein
MPSETTVLDIAKAKIIEEIFDSTIMVEPKKTEIAKDIVKTINKPR